MPSDAKKKRDLQKKNAAKQRQAQGGKKTTGNNTMNGNEPTNANDDECFDENDDGDIQNENENPTKPTNDATNDVDPNVKSLTQNLDLLSMVEKANADARSCTGMFAHVEITQ